MVINSILIQLSQITDDCELRIELVYAETVTQSVHDVWAQGITLNVACVMGETNVGRRIMVSEQCLAVGLRPVGM